MKRCLLCSCALFLLDLSRMLNYCPFLTSLHDFRGLKQLIIAQILLYCNRTRKGAFGRALSFPDTRLVHGLMRKVTILYLQELPKGSLDPMQTSKICALGIKQAENEGFQVPWSFCTHAPMHCSKCLSATTVILMH